MPTIGTLNAVSVITIAPFASIRALSASGLVGPNSVPHRAAVARLGVVAGGATFSTLLALTILLEPSVIANLADGASGLFAVGQINFSRRGNGLSRLDWLSLGLLGSGWLGVVLLGSIILFRGLIGFFIIFFVALSLLI